MTPASRDSNTIIYWHRDLPPVTAELIGDHTIEATSSRVADTFDGRADLWRRCHGELMANVSARLIQEIERLGGDYAHVHDEIIEPRHDEATGEAWLHGQFSYMLYRGTPPQRTS